MRVPISYQILAFKTRQSSVERIRLSRGMYEWQYSLDTCIRHCRNIFLLWLFEHARSPAQLASTTWSLVNRRRAGRGEAGPSAKENFCQTWYEAYLSFAPVLAFPTSSAGSLTPLRHCLLHLLLAVGHRLCHVHLTVRASVERKTLVFCSAPFRGSFWDVWNCRRQWHIVGNIDATLFVRLCDNFSPFLSTASRGRSGPAVAQLDALWHVTFRFMISWASKI